MKSEDEPLLPIEKKLIWHTFGTRVVLLVGLVLLSRLFVLGFGAGDGDRTRDIKLGKLAFYH